MDSSGFNTGRAVAVPLTLRQGVVFGKAAAAAKPGAVGTAGGNTAVAASSSGSGSGLGPSRQTSKGAKLGAQGSHADTEHSNNNNNNNALNRKPSPPRMRKPASASAHPLVKPNSSGAIGSDAELQREMSAKARRLQRFSEGQEISDSVSEPISAGSRIPGKAEPRFSPREARQPGQTPKPSVDNARLDTMDTEALGEDFSSTEAIVGTCDDMCSEIERRERERKGDLDKFERVDGDRNLTSVHLAVKKYTRTPSREPHLIRPLPVLRVTMNYLLSLISQDYDERLLRLHSFLWDRMRAVRMDLRMQHIFNREAITMHEQMIRFHILAMHELCEYKKGEGFNEGFDAHLNIEQMNKASVDLFEMYDDHRKRGIQVETEAEFRGYYALLKLDKHPGYSVEPAELSLDLAKMTPEMRSTPQVLFARDVARACRGCNYIAFFRLARKSTYLQSCLMHAHFAKLRTEALAILHSGLQKNQGVPIPQVVKWLGMEGEDIETLVEYHGFDLKASEKLYAIKDGPFLHRDAEYQARRSRLVVTKRSSTVVEDVEGKGQQQAVIDTWAATPMTSGMQEEEMPDYEEDDPPSHTETSQASAGQGVDNMRISPPYYATSPPREDHTSLSLTSFSSKTVPLWPTSHQKPLILESSTEKLSPQKSRKRGLTQDVDLKEGNKKLVTAGGAIDVEPEEEEDDAVLEPGPTLEEIRAQKVLEWEVEKEIEREKERERDRRKRATVEAEAAAAEWSAKLAADAELKRQRQVEQQLAAYRAEASAGKKRLWLRRWRRRAAIMAEEKFRRRIRAEAALGSLSVGPPIAVAKSDQYGALTTLANSGSAQMSIDQVARVRSEKIREIWKPLDIASLVLPLFEHKFPSTKFITFKLLLSVGGTDASNMAGQWLSNKLSKSQLVIPEVHADGRTPGLWFEAVNVDGSNTSRQETAFHGASGLVFLVRKGVSVVEERLRLHSLVDTLPVAVRLPLLLLYSPKERNIDAETEKLKASLGLFDFEGLRIGWQNVSPVSSSNDGGLYRDGFLCGGLVWLANSSPSQPNLRPIHIRELVTSNLDGHCRVLMASSSLNVTPERCISVFNRSLRAAAMEIRKAVGAAPPHWPPEEVESKVSAALPGILPQEGWNELYRLDPIHQVLQMAELPRFPIIEQVNPGSPTSAWENVWYQKAAVERAMQKYLARIDGINEDDPVLVRQAQMMVRRNSCLEWTASGRMLVPRWANIFQAIYQSRLLLLNSEPPSIVYIVSRDEDETVRPLELDEVEQQVPFASEIAAGTPFGKTRHVNLTFDDTEEREARITLHDKLSLAKSYTDRFRCGDYLSTTPLKQQSKPEEKDVLKVPIQSSTWSIFSPSLESWHRGLPVALKKRRLSLSPEIVIQSLPKNGSNALASGISTESSSEMQTPNSNGVPLVDDREVIGTFDIPRLPEEILLDNIVLKLNLDVDRLLRRASSEVCFADTQVAADLCSDEATNGRSCFRSDCNFPYDGTVDNEVNERFEPIAWTKCSEMGSINDMLERCWRAQKRIDRKLEDTFGTGFDSEQGHL